MVTPEVRFEETGREFMGESVGVELWYLNGVCRGYKIRLGLGSTGHHNLSFFFGVIFKRRSGLKGSQAVSGANKGRPALSTHQKSVKSPT